MATMCFDNTIRPGPSCLRDGRLPRGLQATFADGPCTFVEPDSQLVSDIWGIDDSAVLRTPVRSYNGWKTSYKKLTPESEGLDLVVKRLSKKMIALSDTQSTLGNHGTLVIDFLKN